MVKIFTLDFLEFPWISEDFPDFISLFFMKFNGGPRGVQKGGPRFVYTRFSHNYTNLSHFPFSRNHANKKWLFTPSGTPKYLSRFPHTGQFHAITQLFFQFHAVAQQKIAIHEITEKKTRSSPFWGFKRKLRLLGIPNDH